MIFEGTKKSIFFGLGLTRAGKTQPTYKALRTIKEYCEKNNVEFSVDINIERGSTNG